MVQQNLAPPTARKLDDIVAKAQASISKVLASPLAKRNETFGTPDRDSLMQMRNDFIQDYKEVMKESGETFFKPQHPSLSAQKD